jgi:hypothetical protein
MSAIAVMFPILPGKREKLFEFAKALSGDRSEEYAASQASVTQETWFLQETPTGDFLIVHFESPDPAAVFGALAASTDPFDAWFRQQAQECSGIDLSQPMPGLPQTVFTYRKK